jgi:hypothetical protein
MTLTPITRNVIGWRVYGSDEEAEEAELAEQEFVLDSDNQQVEWFCARDLEPDVIYQFRVRAFSEAGYGDWSVWSRPTRPLS